MNYHQAAFLLERLPPLVLEHNAELRVPKDLGQSPIFFQWEETINQTCDGFFLLLRAYLGPAPEDLRTWRCALTAHSPYRGMETLRRFAQEAFRSGSSFVKKERIALKDYKYFLLNPHPAADTMKKMNLLTLGKGAA